MSLNSSEATISCSISATCSVPSRLSQTTNIDNLLFNQIEDRALFRGIHSRDILRYRCHVLDKDVSGQGFYEQSEQVDHVHTFISHNWSTPRFDKSLVLLLYFNSVPAVIIGMLASFVCFILIILRIIPTHSIVKPMHLLDTLSCWCLTAYVLAFFLALLYFHDVARLFGFKGQSCFLDKSCVHQTDPELKKRAIESLAAWLYYSWDVLVIYTDTYLKRLWTVYELASFLTLHRDGVLYLWPVVMAKVVVGVICINYVTHVLMLLASLRAVQEASSENIAGLYGYLAWAFIAGVASFLASPVAHSWACAQAEIQETITTFSLDKANCCDEQDRDLVKRNIVRFLTHSGYVPADSTDQVAIDKFESRARQEIPRILAASFGQVGMQYSAALLTSFPVMGHMLDWIGAAIVDGHTSWHLHLGLIIYYVQHTFCTWTLSIAVCLYMGRCTTALEKRGLKLYWLNMVMIVIVTLAFYYIVDVINIYFYYMSEQGPLGIAAQGGSMLVSSLIVICVFKPEIRFNHYRRRLGTLDRGTTFGSLSSSDNSCP